MKKHLEQTFYSRTSMKAFFVTVLLILSVWVASEQFTHVDTAIMGYMISSIIFAIGLTFRMSSWLSRTATSRVTGRSITNLLTSARTKRNIVSIFKTLLDNIILQKFIFKRGLYRGIQHFLISWGCIISFAVTFGLTFQWFRFAYVGDGMYEMVVFSLHVLKFPAESIFAEMVYNGLNVGAVMVLFGASMALYRRLKERDLQVTQRVEFDMFPLFILLAVTVSGLLLTLSYSILGGFFHHPLTYVHQICVVVMLCFFPFGKLFHVPIRPLATAVPMSYQETLQVDTKPCARCKKMYSNEDQIRDVKEILSMQNFDLQLDDGTYLADYCVECRRRLRVMKQLNMESPKSDPFGPIQTGNGIHISGFGQKRSEEFYSQDKEKEPIH